MGSLPKPSRSELMRTIRSTPSSAYGLSKSFIALARAAALSLGAIPSSSSKQTISALVARTFGNISGRKPGVKMNDRRGRMLGAGMWGIFSVV